MTSVDSTTKTCSKCKQTYPATREYFPPHKLSKSGLDSWCKACHRESTNKYAAANRELVRERTRKYHATHRAHARQYRIAHRVSRREYDRVWKLANPEKVRAKDHRRRALKRGAEKSNIPFDEKAQLKRQHGKCYYCQCKLDKYTVEHIVPLSRGGSDHPDNKVLACSHCNFSKHNKLPHEWSKGGRLL